MKYMRLLKVLYRLAKRMFLGNEEEQYIRFHQKKQKEKISEYLADSNAPKLHIGAQGNPITGWMNTDILPKSNDIIYLDATQPFPLASESFDYIFSEHMIEHINFSEANQMVSECYRVLKKKGKIRIATPNVKAMVALFEERLSPEQTDYINHMKPFNSKGLPTDPVYAINQMFYGFHHRFIHSQESLTYLLESKGFGSITYPGIRKSSDNNLSNLEQHANEIGEVFNRIETIVVEATK